MNRTMFLISAALTAFVLVVIGGVASRLSVSEPLSEVPTEIVIESTPIVVPAIDPTVEAMIREREAAYQASMAEAQQRLAEANQRLSVAQQQLDTLAAASQSAAVAAPAAQSAPAVAAQSAPAAAAPAAQPAPVQAPVAPPAPTYAVSPEQAQAIAQAAAGSATLMRTPELVSLQGTPAYEVVFDRGAIYVDAQTGAILANTIAEIAQSANPISEDQAIAAAVAYLGGGTVNKVKREYEHGVDVYEVKFSDDSKVYVDAYTAQVVYAKVKNAYDDQNQNTYDNYDDNDNDKEDDDKKDDDKKDDDKKDDEDD
ncbi:PepSY domain-containing protein [Chloroflexus sp.]|uniref:PepSY domain-containing protein n=1 Tax=Chloroflexus sp. TaxID=1904827 RepID=UPI002ADDF0E1|nr:PepSY domain-containing protein [Chloroflexus sp.]